VVALEVLQAEVLLVALVAVLVEVLVVGASVEAVLQEGGKRFSLKF
jgi:hypothetical protein